MLRVMQYQLFYLDMLLSIRLKFMMVLGLTRCPGSGTGSNWIFLLYHLCWFIVGNSDLAEPNNGDSGGLPCRSWELSSLWNKVEIGTYYEENDMQIHNTLWFHDCKTPLTCQISRNTINRSLMSGCLKKAFCSRDWAGREWSRMI